jgi:hypothetical protein
MGYVKDMAVWLPLIFIPAAIEQPNKTNTIYNQSKMDVGMESPPFVDQID